uniref:Uncharacterized protein n=1 Tax=Cannabis sativa TaxID=3483 RepID=A0A803QZ04_CANSA
MASSRASSSSEWCPPEQVSSGEWHPWPHRFELSISQNFGRTVIGSASCLQCRDLGNWPPPLPDLLSSLSLVISSFLSDDRRSQETQGNRSNLCLIFLFLPLSLSLLCRDLGFHRFPRSRRRLELVLGCI